MAEIFIGRLRKRYPAFILGNTQCSDSNVLRDYFPWECFPLLLIGRRVILTHAAPGAEPAENARRDGLVGSGIKRQIFTTGATRAARLMA